MAKKVWGTLVENWSPPILPFHQKIAGRYVHLELLSAEKHAADLYQAYRDHDSVWDYMSTGPYSSSSQFYRWVNEVTAQPDVIYYAIKPLESGKSEGVASYLQIQPSAGSIEVGNIAYAPSLQKTKAATEAMFLMMHWAFEAGYRRYEWKCNALNEASRKAAQRLGFSFEGIFRQAMVVKGRNRDTAWFAMIDHEWPALQEAFDVWLSPRNFDDKGDQKEHLGNLTGLIRANSDPLVKEF
jgi:RimJ/RimL family protein N-acetyltransferase